MSYSDDLDVKWPHLHSTSYITKNLSARSSQMIDGIIHTIWRRLYNEEKEVSRYYLPSPAVTLQKDTFRIAFQILNTSRSSLDMPKSAHQRWLIPGIESVNMMQITTWIPHILCIRIIQIGPLQIIMPEKVT